MTEAPVKCDWENKQQSVCMTSITTAAVSLLKVQSSVFQPEPSWWASQADELQSHFPLFFNCSSINQCDKDRVIRAAQLEQTGQFNGTEQVAVSPSFPH